MPRAEALAAGEGGDLERVQHGDVAVDRDEGAAGGAVAEPAEQEGAGAGRARHHRQPRRADAARRPDLRHAGERGVAEDRAFVRGVAGERGGGGGEDQRGVAEPRSRGRRAAASSAASPGRIMKSGGWPQARIAASASDGSPGGPSSVAAETRLPPPAPRRSVQGPQPRPSRRRARWRRGPRRAASSDHQRSGKGRPGRCGRSRAGRGRGCGRRRRSEPLGEAPADRGGLLQAVAGEAVGEEEVARSPGAARRSRCGRACSCRSGRPRSR